MTKKKIFISSVQKEFATERRSLKEYILGDPLLYRFFDVFLFEDIPAADRPADAVYLTEVDECDIYIGLFGDLYGFEDAEGISPTHREFTRATDRCKYRLIFVKDGPDQSRHEKMRVLIQNAANQLIRRRFGTIPELTTHTYASLVQYLEHEGSIRTSPFDASPCSNATFDDISEDKVLWFLKRARNARGYALAETTPIADVLTHLDLFVGNVPNNAAILLFGKKTQRFLISSEVKCMHFHGTEIGKPIPSYQIYKGTVFELVDQAVDFVMSKLNRSVGTRENGPEAPVEYDIPQQVVAEAIVNAVAHRDYICAASVQIMLFADRLEIWNPGALPPTLTLASLRKPHTSHPGNPLIAEPLFLAKYIEKAGTGTLDIIKLCRKHGLPEPEFKLESGSFVLAIRRKTTPSDTNPANAVANRTTGDQVPTEVPGTKSALSRHQVEIVRKCLEICTIGDLMQIADRTDRTKFRHQVLNPLLQEGLIEMTIPDKPTSSNQRYRTTAKGQLFLK